MSVAMVYIRSEMGAGRGIGMDPGHLGIASRCGAQAWYSGGAARARGARAHEAEDGGVGWGMHSRAVPTRVLNTQHINTTRHEDHRPRFQAA